MITKCRDGAARPDSRCASRPRRAGSRSGPRGRSWGPVRGDARAGVAGEAARIDYSLTLHGPEGERLVGFDNAHPVAKQKRGEPQDHRHRLRTIRAYEYSDAATLLADFWTTVDAVLRERGVIP
jgi:hypothetical protein